MKMWVANTATTDSGAKRRAASAAASSTGASSAAAASSAARASSTAAASSAATLPRDEVFEWRSAHRNTSNRGRVGRDTPPRRAWTTRPGAVL